MEKNILFVLCLCAAVSARSIGKTEKSKVKNDQPDLPDLIRDNTEDELLPKYSGGYGLNEFDIKVVPLDFNTTKCFTGIFCKDRPTTTELPLIFPEGDTLWQRNVQKVIERDRNLDHFPVLKHTFGQEKFSRRQEKKEDSTVYKIGAQIAYAFRPVTALFMGWL